MVSEDPNFLADDINYFYLGNPLKLYEYVRINLKHIPAVDIQQLYYFVDVIMKICKRIIMDFNKQENKQKTV